MKIKGVSLFPQQRAIADDVVRNNTAHFFTILAGRQSGKSVLLSQFIFFYGLNFKKKILVVTPYADQYLQIFDKVIELTAGTDIIDKSNRSEKTIKFKNGTVIAFRSTEKPDNIRSLTAEIVLLDEAALLRKNVIEDYIIQCTTAYSRTFKILLFSTPRGKKNSFFDYYAKGLDKSNPRYECYKMTYKGNPRISEEEIECRRKEMSEARFRQEYLAEFTEGGSIFNYKNCATITKFEPPAANIKYYAGLDLGRKDSTVLTIMNSRGQIVYIYKVENKTWEFIIENILKQLNIYKPLCLIEVNNVGDRIYEEIHSKYYNTLPIYTSNRNKELYIKGLEVMFDKQEIQIPTEDLFEELHIQLDSFEEGETATGKVKFAGKKAHDDMVMSLALCAKCWKENGYFDDNAIRGVWAGKKRF